MERFIIKATYIEGSAKRQVFFMTKGGYVVSKTNPPTIVLKSDTYDSRSAKSTCTKYTKKDKEYNILNLHGTYHFDEATYEPYEVNVVRG